MKKPKLYLRGNFRKGLWIVAGIFAVVGAYVLYRSFASPYSPYNPASETGTATYYNNAGVGGPGHCAAIHYARGKTIKVTNKKVGTRLYNTSIRCLVSDAGPFGNGRVVDLNTNDFRRLAGSTSVGVLPVRLDLVTAQKPKPPAKPAPKPKPKPKPKAKPKLSSEAKCDSSAIPSTSLEDKCAAIPAATPTAAVDQPTNQAPGRNALQKIFDFVQNTFKSIINVF